MVFLAVVALILVIGFLRGWSFERNTYTITVVFTNALGMMQGDLVRMAGVPIGDVGSLGLTTHQRAELILRINGKYRIPEGSQFIARVGLLIGERYVEVVPNRGAKEFLKPGARVLGQAPPRIEDLLPDVQELVKNLATASSGLRELVTDEKVRSGLRQSVRNIEVATASLERTLGGVEELVGRNQDEVDRITRNIAVASDSMRKMAASLEELASDKALRQDVAESVQAARRAVESLERSLTSLEKLVTAQDFQENIRQTVAGARQAVEEARQVIGKAERLFPRTPEIKGKVPPRGLNLDMVYSIDENRFTAELTTTVPIGTDRSLRLGLFDVGAGNKLILQPGQTVGSGSILRYGIYASRLGIGLEHPFSSRAFGRLDVYDSYEPKLNLRAGYSVTKDWSLVLGVDQVFDENRFVAGLRLRQ